VLPPVVGPAERDQSAVRVAQAMFAAYTDGRLDDMLSYLDPHVTWRPMTRPGRSLYRGHSAMAQLVKDVREALGKYRLDWESFTDHGDGRVLCRGQIILISDSGEAPGPSFDCILTFRDGLIIGLETRPRNTIEPAAALSTDVGRLGQIPHQVGPPSDKELDKHDA
jgi:ketosteroid isomerase-like protein